MSTPVQSQNAERRTASDRLPRSASRLTNHGSRVSQHGFTLLEILVSTGVLAVMVTILFALFAEGSNAWRMGEKVAETNQGMRTAMELIVREASLAMIDTNAPPLNLQGLSVVINKTSQEGDQPAIEPSPFGVYEELCFVAPVEIGNGATNNVQTSTAYRPFCGVRYYVTKAPEANGRQPVLGNLMRVIYRPINRGSPDAFFNNPWSCGSGLQTNSAVVAENVLCFRVQPAQNDTVQGLRPANSQMFKSVSSDQSKTINYQNFSGRNPCYPGIYVGVCVVDSRLASRINESGLSTIAKTTLFQAPTNWTLVRFENFRP